ncbi:hypothetical protein FOA43_003427 [Brettanomyces nanus]|uniref:K Homology domain-containing protein n=1 Tax=Eeniella nana TaxID=13502 RepID=A0A875S2V6_EENNA|nr:uncharacterized protein FOA43_003427 [Brettanomyces nanus]QPG76041.1 hypothetical protein FOA43_003427 [Brettanomyces nanus]
MASSESLFGNSFTGASTANATAGNDDDLTANNNIDIDVDLGKTLITYRVLVSRREAGAIIGRNGDNITEIRNNNNVKAGVSKVVDGCIDRILTISGMVDNIPDTMVAIARSVTIANAETVKQADEKGTDPTNLITYDFFPLKPLTQRPLPNEPAYANTLFLRLLIPNSQIGTLIGKGGSRIKNIQETYNVKMVASKGFLENSTERLVELQGTEENMRPAIAAISKCLLRDYQGTATTTYYLPSAAMPAYRRRREGRGTGKEVIKKITFPNEYIGALIGKRGSRIQEVRRLSSCAIAIESDSENGVSNHGEREITIIGTRANIDHAVEMLNDYYQRERQRREEMEE